jgi:hypothetical protein
MSGPTLCEAKDAFTGAPAGHSAPIRVVGCVSYHEWIELRKGSGEPVELTGWMLDDEAEASAASASSSMPYVIPTGSIIEPEGFLLFLRRETRLTLNNHDAVRLLGPDRALLRPYAYDWTAPPDVSRCQAGVTSPAPEQHAR